MPTYRSTRVVLPDGERAATIRIEGGRIVEVGDDSADVDFGDLVVLPGLVDSHVHVNEPGRTEWEGFATATRAAAAGGSTTIVDMPLNSIPPTVDVESLDIKRSAATGQVSVDVAFWGGIIPGSEGSIADLVAAGACGFKAFLVDSGVPEFPPMTPEGLAEVLSDLGGTPLLIHAEDHDLLADADADGDPRSYATYLATRPGASEAAAIERVADFGRRTKVHILHVAGAEAVDAIRRSDPSGELSAETCPHYLTFRADEIPDGATAFKCAPPIRTAEDRETLWEALGDGTLAMVVSDHSPAPPAIKDLEGGDFLEAWGGIASLELRLPAVWNGASQRGYGVERLAEWLSSAPARLAGLSTTKGSLSPGRDGDFVVFDPDGVTRVDARRLHQRHPVTPYDGLDLRGSVVSTYRRGTPVFGPGAVTSPTGELLTRGV